MHFVCVELVLWGATSSKWESYVFGVAGKISSKTRIMGAARVEFCTQVSRVEHWGNFCSKLYNISYVPTRQIFQKLLCSPVMAPQIFQIPTFLKNPTYFTKRNLWEVNF